MRLLLLLLLSFTAFSACKKDPTAEEILADDINKIKADLAAKNLTAQSTASGLHYIIGTPGSNEHPTIADNVIVRYKGTLLDGTVFDQTQGSQTINFPLSDLILGWQEAIPLLGRSGKGTFWLPSALGYGSRGAGDIPPNSVLIFEIELVDFN